jgi:preprotein translocase subunit YajC
MIHLMGLLFSNYVFAQTADVAATATQAAPPSWMQFVPFAVIIVVFYFFLIRPQAKKQKETQSFLTALKTGDNVITNSGILGRITGMNDALITLEIANGVQIKILRAQVMSSQEVLKVQSK